ncbi:MULTISPECIES: ABC transporter ATP-binding protein [unclassified Streptomyces]|uniref:ABC transporter ATP-binding protein n=1 Tax=unclassified Streptomyces TaxID=2593676 RepID=UPI00224DDE1E|nr:MULTISPECIES: ATP-binding cassette domain-containing protein [unclassified Streptomyces]MCX5057471.1 ATP-binding cassette domain-containing protein [Streptomyces sp. NBC_00452]MCX5288545.1 ATP-binding cassette domain-containing protein [Streptomyces sp. NBC_00183]
MIRFEDVSVTYDGAAEPTVRGVDFEVPEGELVLLVGPSGAGKSTVLGTVSGLVPHFTGGTLRGRVTVAERDTRTHKPRELADVVGTVGQDPLSHFVTDTVEDELAYGMESLGLAPDVMRRRVEETLDLLGLAGLRDRPIATLSGGQQQRVAIGSVLTPHPRVLVLDEPTSALDPAAAEEVLAVLQRLVHDLGTTVLLAEHRLERVIQYADLVAVLPAPGVAPVLGTPAEMMAVSPVYPPVVALGRLAGWTPLPLTVRDARRRAGGLRERLAEQRRTQTPTDGPTQGASPADDSPRQEVRAADDSPTQGASPADDSPRQEVRAADDSPTQGASPADDSLRQEVRAADDSPRQGASAADSLRQEVRTADGPTQEVTTAAAEKDADPPWWSWPFPARRRTSSRTAVASPTPAPTAEVRALAVRRDRVEALRHVDLTVTPGETIALMGRNGAGKSTLLNTLVGLVEPSAGTVRVGGAVPHRTAPPDLVRRVGLVPQEPRDLLYADTVAGECAAADRDARAEPGACRSLVSELLPGITDDVHPRDLSEGQRLTLALAVVLTARPPLLLLDEPTRGLDYAAKARLVTVLRALAAEGHTIVLATHDVELAAELAHRVVLLADGEVIADGPTADVVVSSPSFAPQITKILAPQKWLTVSQVREALA